ncbi:IS5 family transposase [Coraliomargarita sp. SDUM461004]|uniref:IS5 family transposase n=1 Tax=Thalassobacterium sedimentorum TaxID=3041258 RepID=A0ABU1AN16_9BACT|nr:IS5 family transposase [Coraliomargarita sp. SDUM461004]MDQ8196194.1 IS5 family transposase [Coraliomargarita sp. SDUM461004]
MSDEVGLFGYLDRVNELKQRPTALDKLNESIDWSCFKSVLKEHLNFKDRSKRGRKPLDSILMFKVLILQKYYNLSEEETEFHILDRFSFQRFLGLSASDKVPDKNTIWLFKQRLGTEGIAALFNYFSGCLQANGFEVSAGKIVDASFVEVPRQQNSSEENKQIKSGEVPENWQKKPARMRQKDLDARWTTKSGHPYFGYKNHIKVDWKSKLIERWGVTAANTHGWLMLDWLRGKGIAPQINERAYRGRPLTQEQKDSNRLKSSVRARVEHVFGVLSNSMGADQIRCIGLDRAKQSNDLGNLVYNRFRFKQLGGSMLK